MTDAQFPKAANNVESPEVAIVDAIMAALEPWARRNGGKAQVAEDPQHSIDLIIQDQAMGLTATVFWGSDNVSDESREPSGSLMEGVVNVVLSRPISLELDKARANRRTLELCHGLRGAVTGIDYMGVEWLQRSPRYAGKTPVAVAPGRLLNGYLLKFNVTYLRAEPEE